MSKITDQYPELKPFFQQKMAKARAARTPAGMKRAGRAAQAGLVNALLAKPVIEALRAGQPLEPLGFTANQLTAARARLGKEDITGEQMNDWHAQINALLPQEPQEPQPPATAEDPMAV